MDLSHCHSLSPSLHLLPILLLAIPTPISPLHTHLALTGPGTGIGSVGKSYFLSLFTSTLTLCLGLQTPLGPTTLNGGEYPACAALTTGYVFRVENAATVAFLQKMTRTGCLMRFEVGDAPAAEVETGSEARADSHSQARGEDVSSSSTSTSHRRSSLPNLSVACLPTTILLSWTFFPLRASSFDVVSATPSFICSLTLLLLSRLLATIAFLDRTRAGSQSGWHGAPEPGVHGDLLILLSEDRWARMSGLVDDLKAVTSGRWLASRRRDGAAGVVSLSASTLMDCLEWTAAMMVWVEVVVLGGASDLEKAMLVGTVVAGHLILVYENARAAQMVMKGRVVNVAKGPSAVKRYVRRLDMARELIREVGRSDFAVRLGLINPEQVSELGKDHEKIRNEVVTM
ncbi:hypothetical protein A1O7_00199 [Cladophialophora yegresii CBS 114405]|uniref:Uncharacterized protein n=1 Tax=Cladophialophora yegresii CBS 114405 TaxID=1182544 RepID=W9X065_9EURO|nr:uncharacterized protein A1O7_00199 [Cladophialophora yegresii CBS 114405]EXJ63864.1 hypothetical protein A1O7_00199 [Cladophialophora yegresii CBS 114405]